MTTQPKRRSKFFQRVKAIQTQNMRIVKAEKAVVRAAEKYEKYYPCDTTTHRSFGCVVALAVARLRKARAASRRTRT